MSQENLTACIDNIKAITSEESLSPVLTDFTSKTVVSTK